MQVQRIGSIVSAQPVTERAGGDGAGRALMAGTTVRLTVEAQTADGSLLVHADGLQLRLAGLANIGVGDVLLLKVLAVAPRLELALLGVPVRAEQPNLASTPELAAMQPDQLAQLRQSLARAPDAGILAVSWRALVLCNLDGQLALHEQARGRHLPASVFQSGGGAGALHALETMPPVSGNWMFATYAWGGQRVHLQVLAGEDDAPPRRRRGAALRVQFALPDFGPIGAQLQLTTGGVWLDLMAEHAAGRRRLRTLMRALASAIARAGLRLVRCRLVAGLPPAAPAAITAVRALPPALFEAAAEVVSLLAAPPSP